MKIPTATFSAKEKLYKSPFSKLMPPFPELPLLLLTIYMLKFNL